MSCRRMTNRSLATQRSSGRMIGVDNAIQNDIDDHNGFRHQQEKAAQAPDFILCWQGSRSYRLYN